CLRHPTHDREVRERTHVRVLEHAVLLRRTRDVVVLVRVGRLRKMLRPQVRQVHPEPDAVRAVRAADGVHDRVPEEVRCRHILGLVRVAVDLRQALVAPERCKQRECRNGLEQSLGHCLMPSFHVHEPYGRTVTEKPMLRAPGTEPYSKPCTLLASKPVSGSTSRFSSTPHIARLRPIRPNWMFESPSRFDHACGALN